MKTKEEILAKNCRYFDDYGGLDEIYKSMEEYASQNKLERVEEENIEILA